MNKEEQAEKIVENIVSDLTDRRGLKQEWWMIDEDIQKEIKETWKEIILIYLYASEHINK